jgi:hypothetical protein
MFTSMVQKAVGGMLRRADRLPFASGATSGSCPAEDSAPFKPSTDNRNVFVKPVE